MDRIESRPVPLEPAAVLRLFWENGDVTAYITERAYRNRLIKLRTS
jgi:hypothetical protein